MQFAGDWTSGTAKKKIDFAGPIETSPNKINMV
jgi:hypothetical protein